MDKPGKNEELGTLVRSTRLAVPNYLSGGVITCLAVDDKLNMAAIGFSNHCLLLLRGDITRDRGTKQKILLDASKPPSKTQSHDTNIHIHTKMSGLKRVKRGYYILLRSIVAMAL